MSKWMPKGPFELVMQTESERSWPCGDPAGPEADTRQMRHSPLSAPLAPVSRCQCQCARGTGRWRLLKYDHLACTCPQLLGNSS